MLFALGLVPAMGAIAVAVDYSSASSARTAIAAAADAAAIAGARTIGQPVDRERAARAAFDSNLRIAGLTAPVNARFINVTKGNTNSGYRVEAQGIVKSMMGAFSGRAETPVATIAEAISGAEEPTEVAFVLDTTDSMEGDRLDTMKSAATGVIDTLTRTQARPDQFKVGIVPFAQYVNVGLQNRTAHWIDVPSDYRTPETTSCSMQFVQVGETNCRDVFRPAEPASAGYTCMRDGRARICGRHDGQPARMERVCDPVMSSTPQQVCHRSGGDWVRWTGCVGSRNAPLNTQDGNYGTRIPGILGVDCASPVQDLTTNLASMKTAINGLTTNGETYLPAGLIWGWRMLSAGAPFAAADPGNTPTRKFMIVLTDGRNTKSPTYPRHDGSDSALSDQLSRDICTNIAADQTNRIRIYTIAFEVEGLATKAILNDCAVSTGGRFFDATDAMRLREAFDSIAAAIVAVRLVR